MTIHFNTFRKTSLFAAGCIMLSLFSCDEAPVLEESLRPVRYQEVFSQGGNRTRSFSGVAQSSVESRLSFKVRGTIKKLDVKVGDEVRAGQAIAELDTSDYELQVEQAQASLEQAKAEQRNAEANYDRVRQLFENRNASRNDLDSARAASESATAQVQALVKQLELNELQLSYTKISAPISGAIASVDVDINENVQAGQAIVQLSSGSELEVIVAIPEVLIAQVRTGDAVEVSFDALPDQKFPARVTEVSVSSTGSATTFPVTVLLQEASQDVRAGMATEVSFQFGASETRERFVVPSFAVLEDREGRFVFTIKAASEAGEGVIERKAITIGNMTEDGVEVFDGLIDGDLVVTAGVSRIIDGQTVKFDPK